MVGTAPRASASRVTSRNGQGITASGVEVAAEDVVRDAYDSTARAYVEEFGPFFDRVQANWPVATGFSAGALELDMRIVDSRVVGSVRNLASYAGYITQRKFRVPNAVKRLVWDPSAALADRLLERVGSFLGSD